jgi:hypothetical protein
VGGLTGADCEDGGGQMDGGMEGDFEEGSPGNELDNYISGISQMLSLLVSPRCSYCFCSSDDNTACSE